jgi:hypothetical protein
MIIESNPVQYFLSVAPIRLAACQKRIKGLGMIMVFQVAKLIHGQFRRNDDAQPFAVFAMKVVSDPAGTEINHIHGAINPHWQSPPLYSGL